MHLPWRQFVPVKRARVDPSAAPLDPSKTRQLGLVLSRFEFNGLANPNYKAGRFSLKVGLLYLERHSTSALLWAGRSDPGLHCAGDQPCCT